MIIKSREWEKMEETDLLVFTIGHEQRSTYLYSLCEKTRNQDNTLIFSIKNNQCAKEERDKIEKKGISILECGYTDYELVIDRIKRFICKQKQSKRKINIDYSSMPRSWYCRIPGKIYDANEIYMWYSAGNYPDSYIVYPSAVEKIYVFSGKTIPSADIKRYHFMGLGFDAIRTETIRTVVEPDSLICCCAYDPQNTEIKKVIFEKNRLIMNDSMLTASFSCNNFYGMVYSLCGMVNDILAENSQAILIPDGPKPLVMAMSLVPEMINKPGVTCLHIQSNERHYKPVNILPKGDIWGFSIA